MANIEVIGLMIGAEYKNFKLFQMNESWSKRNKNGIFTGGSGSSLVEGLKDILGYLSIPVSEHAQFVVVYNADCPNKEEHLKKILGGINKIKKNDLLPALVCIGHEEAPLSDEILEQSGVVKEVANTGTPMELLEQIITNELNNTKKQILAAEKVELPKIETASSSTAEKNTSSTTNISMVVLNGFIAAAGIAAVAVAFTLLNAATFGITGLVVAIGGAAAALTGGAGFFATGGSNNKSKNNDESIEYSTTFAHP